jgi:beta-1,2-mannobiose phosphorylase / 1,2-beta-oligomannan phosphorylase
MKTRFTPFAAILFVLGEILSSLTGASAATPQPLVLKPEAFRHYIDAFNRNDEELYVQHFPNATAWEFLRANVPLLDYNHSTFCDLVINGLIGLRPRDDNTIEVNPLVPAGVWDYFCLDQVRYHGQWLTIVYDRTGDRYHRGAGLRVFADGRLIAVAPTLGKVVAPLGLPTPARSASEEGDSPPRTRNASGTGDRRETSAGWLKAEQNPLLGGKYGTCFDISVLKDGEKYRMWLSWRPRQSVAIVESGDGIHWSGPPRIVLSPNKESGWEDAINRPYVLKKGEVYHMWYTGQVRPGAANGHSWIGYATSRDGLAWKRMSDRPVLSFDQPWEKNIAVMCPSVLWDESAKRFRMWYCGGEQSEPNAIGYATSLDGLTWTKYAGNPVFAADPKNPWERHKVAGVQVVKCGDWHLMFYIGYRDEPSAKIGLARSRDGITHWERHPANPIVRPGEGKWDHDACYKPFAIFDGRKWLLWYNGRHGSLEQIGAALHEGKDLGFE